MLNAGHILRWTGDICLAGATFGCFYLVIASVLIAWFRSERRCPPASIPSLTVLVPLCGAEPDLHRRLSILCGQNYPAPVQIIFGSDDIDDPAIDVVRHLTTKDARHSIEFHIDTRIHGANRKISNLINMARHALYGTLVMLDSDIEIGTNHLSKITAELRRPGIGAVTCPYKGVATRGIFARLAALRINIDFLPSVIVGSSFALAHPCFGACIAISKHILRRIGGLEAFADQLWEDYAIGNAVRALGYDVSIAPFAVGHAYADETFSGWLTNELRAARTIRAIEPIGYAGTIMTYPLPLALIASITYGYQAIGLAFIALACRMIVWLSIEHRFRTGSENVILLPLREFLSFVVYFASFIGASVQWRGRHYRLSRGAAIATRIRM